MFLFIALLSKVSSTLVEELEKEGERTEPKKRKKKEELSKKNLRRHTRR